MHIKIVEWQPFFDFHYPVLHIILSCFRRRSPEGTTAVGIDDPNAMCCSSLLCVCVKKLHSCRSSDQSSSAAQQQGRRRRIRKVRLTR